VTINLSLTSVCVAMAVAADSIENETRNCIMCPSRVVFVRKMGENKGESSWESLAARSDIIAISRNVPDSNICKIHNSLNLSRHEIVRENYLPFISIKISTRRR